VLKTEAPSTARIIGRNSVELFFRALLMNFLIVCMAKGMGKLILHYYPY
jgi:hypothetical protein